MGLDFEHLLEGVPENLNGSRLVLFSNTSKEGSTVVHDCNLVQIDVLLVDTNFFGVTSVTLDELSD